MQVSGSVCVAVNVHVNVAGRLRDAVEVTGDLVAACVLAQSQAPGSPGIPRQLTVPPQGDSVFWLNQFPRGRKANRLVWGGRERQRKVVPT